MKTRVWNCIALAVGLAVCPIVLSAAAKQAKDGLEYTSLEELQKKWQITSSGFPTAPVIELISSGAKEGKKALRIKLPPTPAGAPLARIDLIVTPEMPLKQVKQISFWYSIDNPTALAAAGLHCGDSDWANYYTDYRWTSAQNGWQRIAVSTDAIGAGGGNPSWDKTTQMRLNFFVGPGSPGATIILDDFTWSTTRERDRKLNKKWWDD